VIMDTTRRERIACIQAMAGPKDFYPAPADQMVGDQQNEDVNYIAMRLFEQQVRQCIDRLRAMDVPAAATQPSPWRGGRPFDREIPPIYIIPNRSSNW
jgi:hypothetical protein